MTAQKSAFYIELTKGSLAVDFRWILLVVDKLSTKFQRLWWPLAVNKYSPSGDRPAKSF